MSGSVDIQSGLGGLVIGALGSVATLYASFASRKTTVAEQLREEQAAFRAELRGMLTQEREDCRREREELEAKIIRYEADKKEDRHFINNLKGCLAKALTILELPEELRPPRIEALKQTVERLEINVL